MKTMGRVLSPPKLEYPGKNSGTFTGNLGNNFADAGILSLLEII
jgi:hypothetical protein